MIRSIATFIGLLALAALAGAQTPASVVTLTWSAPTANVDTTPITDPITYTIYQNGSRVSSKITALTYVTTVTTGKYSFQVTANTISGGESARTPPLVVNKLVPTAKPAPPANVVGTLSP